MYCPITRDDCMEGACGWWCIDHEDCAMALLGNSLSEISFAADEANLECGIRVHVTREKVE